MISSLLGKLHLHESSPQAARRVARAIIHIFFICRSVDSFTLILHLSGYPQGRDRFTSSSVCKLYVDANGIKVMPRIGQSFLCKQYIYKSSKTPFQHGQLRQPGLPVSYLPLQLSQLWVDAGTPSPHTSAAIRARKVVLEGGRKVYVVLTTFVGPGPELYMTEYVAIRIVFTLQGLYTCTYSNRCQPEASRLTSRHRSTENKN